MRLSSHVTVYLSNIIIKKIHEILNYCLAYVASSYLNVRKMPLTYTRKPRWISFLQNDVLGDDAAVTGGTA